MVRATRNRKPTNYALDPYKDLDSDNTDPPAQRDSSEDEDFQIAPKSTIDPNAPEDADAADASPSDDASVSDELSPLEDDDASDEGYQQRGSKKPRTPRTTLVRGATLEATPGEGARLHRPHKFRVNRLPESLTGMRRRDRLAMLDTLNNPDAEVLPIGMRPPDPSVKITYRPGFIKSTGKRERIVTAYGGNNETLVKAVKVRDTYIGLPAVPERSCLGFTPFWKKGQDEHVDMGMGRQKTQRVEYYDAPGTVTGAGVERYLPAATGFQIKCIIGPQTGKKIITFQRFGMHDLAGTGKGKKGFILNAGGHVLGMDWAPNRPKGVFLLQSS